MFLACSRQGYVCNPSLHQNYTVAEIVELLTRIRAAALFAQPGYGADARTADIFAAVAELPRPAQGLSVGASRRARRDVRRPFPDRRRRGRRGCRRLTTNPDKIVYLAFTSGTTGTPKGVMHSDNTLLANARAMVEDWGHDHRTVLLSLSPLSHHIAHRRVGAGNGGRHGAGGQRAAAGEDPARLDYRDRRDLCDGRADARDGHSRRDAAARHRPARRGQDVSTWPGRRSRARWRRPFSTAASPRRTSMA